MNQNAPVVTVNSLSPADKVKVKDAIHEMADSMTRMDAEKELQKKIIENIHESLGVEKKIFRRMAKTYFRSTFSKEVEVDNLFHDFYEVVVNSTSGNGG